MNRSCWKRGAKIGCEYFVSSEILRWCSPEWVKGLSGEGRDGGRVIEVSVVRNLGDNCVSSRWENKCVYFEPYFDRESHEREGLPWRNARISEAEVR